ncbi:MAG: hypothetical protein CVU90_15570 [Firmicutes bacterium HGW-Firmicutes-15]|nr:MAG: hypothetical protein CVU90_15570 [Firmicutes bacterium HGW-Firmicutes-15]
MALIYGYSPVKDAVHRMRYGTDRVSYQGRYYLNPTVRTFTELPVNGEIVPTGEKVIGLPVFDTESGMQFQKERNIVPTLLILKQSEDKFLVYSLSGGP